MLLPVALSQSTPQNVDSNPSLTDATPSPNLPQQQPPSPAASDASTSDDVLIAGLDLTPQTILILVVMLLLSFIMLCVVIGYCIRYKSKKRESERAKAELRRMDDAVFGTPVHHDVQPVYVTEIRAARLNPAEEHQKTDTINTGGTYDYAPSSKQYSENMDLYIPQYASTVATEETPPYHKQRHPQQQPLQQPHHQQQQRPHRHHKKRDIRETFVGGKRRTKTKSRGRTKYRHCVQEDAEQNYGFEHHAGAVVDDGEVIQYNVRDGFIR